MEHKRAGQKQDGEKKVVGLFQTTHSLARSADEEAGEGYSLLAFYSCLLSFTPDPSLS